MKPQFDLINQVCVLHNCVRPRTILKIHQLIPAQLLSTPGSDVEGLRQRYPQLHLTIVQADALSDVRRFGHCQGIIALREEISAGTDALLSRLLRHRYIRLEGGMNGVIAQFDAWLASPGSIAAGSRRSVPFGGMERGAASGRHRQNRYPKRLSDAG